jgi:hypothetical protein
LPFSSTPPASTVLVRTTSPGQILRTGAIDAENVRWCSTGSKSIVRGAAGRLFSETALRARHRLGGDSPHSSGPVEVDMPVSSSPSNRPE